jgi:thiosulfate/3-mercaptopyruvate sulfurtransferase
MTGDELARALAEGRVTLLDARTPGEYAGEAGYPCDPRQGHIPGAVNVEWSELYEQEGRPHEAGAIRRLLAERGADADRPLVVYCHSGQRSAFAVAALRAAGFDAENYEGSWHEWSRRDPA